MGELSKALRSMGLNPTDRQLREMFAKADIDGDGQINYEEFVKMMMSS